MYTRLFMNANLVKTRIDFCLLRLGEVYKR
ncbi:Uncharacterised protein [Porphyromonas macacae]|uniref:Uncharacterized protein n=1 Tax=Porphyromonas macacae TaxID=28115 RepID=A0A379DI61_9PORP|nr:Uncharacterised protein [Porphyromonas macacae]